MTDASRHYTTAHFFSMPISYAYSLTYSGSALGNQLRSIVLGDWGERLLEGQDQVAAGMAVWSETQEPAWIITTGDNIYPKGIFSWDDPQVDIKWRDVYYQVNAK